MANVEQAIDFVLRQEDAEMTGAVTTLPGDAGGATRFGLASRFHPELVIRGFFDVNRIDTSEALAIALTVYQQNYADPLLIAQIDDQALATAVLSFGINAGISRSVRLLQRTVNLQGIPIVMDGLMGPATLRLVNQVPAQTLLQSFAVLCSRYYTTLAATNPQDAGDLKGWLNRVNAWLQSAPQMRRVVEVV